MSEKCILLIDDDPSVTSLLTARLEAISNISVHAINQPEDALNAAKTFNPALIICDIDMGETGGGDVAFALRNDPKTAAIPVMFLSSMVTPQDMGESARGTFMLSKKIGLANIV
jgi:CheY-like chemotaxis protein